MFSTTSSTGGRTIQISGGLIHYQNTEKLINVANSDVESSAQIFSDQKIKFDFSAHINPVVATSPQGRIIRF